MVARLAFAVLALPAVARAGWHLHRLRAERNLDRLASGMRGGATFRLALLRQPEYHAALLERLIGLLPPRSWGPCLKKSLLLMELWTRCGLEPTLHLGAQLRAGRRFDFHAWISAGDRVYGQQDHEELWSSRE